MNLKFTALAAAAVVIGGAGLVNKAIAKPAKTKVPAKSTAKPAAKPKVAPKVTPKVAEKKVPPVLNFTMKSLAGKDVDLAKYQGKVVLIVNVASHCGYTAQYPGIEALYKKYAGQGLAVLGFPANNFGAQEPGSDEEIATFCQKNYGVSFDMFSKVSVKGDDKTPLYQYLTSETTNPKFPGEVGWNFEKFLIGRNGEIAGRFASGVTPEAPELVSAIEAELAKK